MFFFVFVFFSSLQKFVTVTYQSICLMVHFSYHCLGADSLHCEVVPISLLQIIRLFDSFILVPHVISFQLHLVCLWVEPRLSNPVRPIQAKQMTFRRSALLKRRCVPGLSEMSLSPRKQVQIYCKISRIGDICPT